jgi:uncharacterized protein YbgA (DUF1722 family)/uncharacterized protein YbbK (DUF523 family)
VTPRSEAEPAQREIRVGISPCLLGEKVRYDGGHKREGFITETLAQYVTFVPFCPEVEVGLGVPRETIHLVERDGGIRLQGTRSGDDHTAAMTKLARARSAELEKMGLAGYIFKKGSPSCGLFRVPVRGEGARPKRNGRGLFARAVTEAMPLLPVEEEGRLQDPARRESFFVRLFAHDRLRAVFGPRWKLGDLVRFHSREKLLVLAHDPKAYKEMGQLVARGKQVPRKELAADYQARFMNALARRATRGKQTNVLQHMAGYLKKEIDRVSRTELMETIGDYRRGLVPLIVPVTLLKHHVRLQDVEYLAAQSYLSPHPAELMLRNHA